MTASLTLLVVAVIFSKAESQVSITSEKVSYPIGDPVTLNCTVPDFSDTVSLRLNGNLKVECFAGFPACTSPGTGYTVQKVGTTALELHIAAFNQAQDAGEWECSHGSTLKSQITLSVASPETTNEEPPSTTEQSTFGSSVISIASSHSTIGSGQTLSTHLAPTSDVGRFSLVVPTDGRINSLITVSNLPDETMTFSSIFLVITDTSSLIFQTSASSYISPYYISNTYPSNFLMSTLTTNIFGSGISLPLSSSGFFLGHYNESSFKSSFDTMISDLSIFSTNSALFSSFSTINAIESSNFISLSEIYSVDSMTGMTFTIGNRISTLINSAYISGFSPSFVSYLAGVSTETLLSDHSMQSEESLTNPTTLSNLDTNSILLTTFTPNDTSIFYLSSKYINSVDFESSFNFDSNTKNGTIRTSTTKIIETMALNSIAESHETESATISMNYDLSSNMLISSPITPFGSTTGTLIVHPTMVEINMSIDSFFETFEKEASTLSVDYLQTRSLSESKTVGDIMSTDTLFERSSISPSASFNHIHESLSLHTGIESESVYKAISSAKSVLFDSFSILPEKDSDNVLSITSDVVVWSSDVSRISLGRLSPLGSRSYDSTAYISTKYMSSIYVNSDKYSPATNTHLSQPTNFVSTILPSGSKYFYSSDINRASSSLLMSSSVNERSVNTYSPSLTKSSKVIAISVTVVGCILLVAITILVLFVLKLLKCKPRSKVSKTNKKFTDIDSNSLSISTGERRGISLFDKPYGLPTRYYDKTATSWRVNDNPFTCTYNKNWDDIT